MVEPYYADDRATLYHGDCLDVLADLPDCSIDAVVTDPPYGLRFMGAAWDGADIITATRTRQAQAAMPDDGKAGANGGYRSASTEAGRYDLSANAAFGLWCQAWASECLRVLKPGGHLVSFGGSRTWHRLASAVEDAGFEIRDSIAWLYAQGFPKSLDVSKAIDKTLGATGAYGNPKSEAHAGWVKRGAMRGTGGHEGYQRPWMQDEGAVDTAARKYIPGSNEATVFAGWGTALKPSFEPVVVARKPLSGTVAATVLEHGTGALNIGGCRVATTDNAAGRWPANVVLDGEMAARLDEQSGVTTSGSRKAGTHGLMGYMGADAAPMPEVHGDSGGLSRMFPVFRCEPKATTAERPQVDGIAHPTVKPLNLMRWLVRLVTPPGGTVLEPFAGSGTTLEAALIEGFACIGIEREADYLPLILSRITKPLEQTLNFESEAS